MQQKSINLSWSKGCFLMCNLHGDGVHFQVCTHVHRPSFQQHYFCSTPFTLRDSICSSEEASNILGFTFLSSSFSSWWRGPNTSGRKNESFCGEITDPHCPTSQASPVWCLGAVSAAHCLLCVVWGLKANGGSSGDLKPVLWPDAIQPKLPGCSLCCPRDLQPQNSSTKMNCSGLKRSRFLCLGYWKKACYFSKKLFFPVTAEIEEGWYWDPTGSSENRR